MRLPDAQDRGLHLALNLRHIHMSSPVTKERKNLTHSSEHHARNCRGKDFFATPMKATELDQGKTGIMQWGTRPQVSLRYCSERAEIDSGTMHCSPAQKRDTIPGLAWMV